MMSGHVLFLSLLGIGLWSPLEREALHAVRRWTAVWATSTSISASEASALRLHDDFDSVVHHGSHSGVPLEPSAPADLEALTRVVVGRDMDARLEIAWGWQVDALQSYSRIQTIGDSVELLLDGIHVSDFTGHCMVNDAFGLLDSVLRQWHVLMCLKHSLLVMADEAGREL